MATKIIDSYEHPITQVKATVEDDASSSCTPCKRTCRGEGGPCCFGRILIPAAPTASGAQQINEREVACVKRGIVPVEHHCRAFKYDPLKRVPPRPAVAGHRRD